MAVQPVVVVAPSSKDHGGASLVHLVRALSCAVLLGLALVLASATPAQALPKNFRNVDIFYVGGLPSAADMEELRTLGVTRIVSLHRLPASAEAAAAKYGIEVFQHPLRTRLLDAELIMSWIEEVPAGSVYVHCLHGADRTGAVTAYWLTTRRGFDPFVALALVLSPREYHVQGLRQLVREYAISFELDESLIGRYSGALNGGLEGFKVRGNPWYTRLARHYLEVTVGPPVRDPSESFWGAHGSGKFDR